MLSHFPWSNTMEIQEMDAVVVVVKEEGMSYSVYIFYHFPREQNILPSIYNGKKYLNSHCILEAMLLFVFAFR